MDQYNTSIGKFAPADQFMNFLVPLYQLLSFMLNSKCYHVSLCWVFMAKTTNLRTSHHVFWNLKKLLIIIDPLNNLYEFISSCRNLYDFNISSCSCFEMLDSENPPKYFCSAEGLLQQVMDILIVFSLFVVELFVMYCNQVHLSTQVLMHICYDKKIHI